MKSQRRSWSLSLLFFLFFFLFLAQAAAQAQDEDLEWAPAPPRLSYIDGEVSYWREGADDWVRARPNLALAEGDALYAGRDARFELEFDSRAFARADQDSELSLLSRDERNTRFRLGGGRASFDLLGMTVGDSLEISTPNAVVLVEHPGYFRVEVDDRETRLITRRGGEAELIMADGRSLRVYPSEYVVVSAGDPARVATYSAPPPDAWDRWNDKRSDRVDASVSRRYLPPDVYGVDDLDLYGYWRVMPVYGMVWIPHHVGQGWAPYSTGSWVWDPYYEWTWVDDSPWGWAPFHYGRWVYLDGYWAWVPGPVVRRSIYAPALVVFLGLGRDVSVSIGFGTADLWWVSLGWGEPVLPWWGHHRHRGHPRWAGWGGPRIVNNVVIQQTVNIRAEDIQFQNARAPRAVQAAPAGKFGRERGPARAEGRYRHTDFAPLRGALPIKPTRASLHGGAAKAAPPPVEVLKRAVVTTRAPRKPAPVLPDLAKPARALPEPRYVIPPRRDDGKIRGSIRPPTEGKSRQERASPSPPPMRKGEERRAAPPVVSIPATEPDGKRKPVPPAPPRPGVTNQMGKPALDAPRRQLDRAPLPPPPPRQREEKKSGPPISPAPAVAPEAKRRVVPPPPPPAGVANPPSVGKPGMNVPVPPIEIAPPPRPAEPRSSTKGGRDTPAGQPSQSSAREKENEKAKAKAKAGDEKR